MYGRSIKLLKSNSFFLFGARGTGKSTLLKGLFSEKDSFYIDLLDYDLELKFSADPAQFKYLLDSLTEKKHIHWIIIDEVQKIPGLLNYVHQYIESKNFKFALTGSSARKLKRGSANLLAGRAFQNFLYPLSYSELKDDFDLNFSLRWGSLPSVFSMSDEAKKRYLKTYVQTYLKEEIQAEQLVRKLQPFRAFLNILGQVSGTQLNYSKISRDINSDPVTVKKYFEILEDTLIGFRLLPFHTSIRKRQSGSPKFYLFDLGVRRALLNQLNLDIEENSISYGVLFEHFLINEFIKLNSYLHLDWQFFYMKTKDNAEVDLIIERPGKKNLAIEIKSTSKVTRDHLNNFIKISKDLPNSESLCLSNDINEKKIQHVRCIHWRSFLDSQYLLALAK